MNKSDLEWLTRSMKGFFYLIFNWFFIVCVWLRVTIMYTHQSFQIYSLFIYIHIYMNIYIALLITYTHSSYYDDTLKWWWKVGIHVQLTINQHVGAQWVSIYLWYAAFEDWCSLTVFIRMVFHVNMSASFSTMQIINLNLNFLLTIQILISLHLSFFFSFLPFSFHGHGMISNGFYKLCLEFSLAGCMKASEIILQ